MWLVAQHKEASREMRCEVKMKIPMAEAKTGLRVRSASHGWLPGGEVQDLAEVQELTETVSVSCGVWRDCGKVRLVKLKNKV